MDLIAGQIVGPYRLVERAGGGGMGVVWRAVHPKLERQVAIKFISPLYAADPTFLDRFLREAKAISRLDHPNILTVYDYGEQEGWTYMVGPFIGGGTLTDRLRRGVWSVEEAITVLAPLTAALDYAHSEGIVHRDIKPDNIMFTERDRLVLTDFGIARIVEASTLLSLPGTPIGTPVYMSPEQADGQSVGPASDLYSVGVLTYQMLTGRPPFVADTPLALIRAHIDKPPPSPRSFNPDIPESVDAALSRMLVKDPSGRFPTGRDFVSALATANYNPGQHASATAIAPIQSFHDRQQSTLPLTKIQPARLPGSGSTSRRRAVMMLGAVLTSGVGIGLGAFLLAEWRRSATDISTAGREIVPAAPTAGEPIPASTTDPTATSAQTGASQQVIAPTNTAPPVALTVPSGPPVGQLVVVLQVDAEANDLFLLRLGDVPRRLTGPSPENRWSWAPAISPDARKVAFNFGTPGRADIVIMGIDGSGRSVVATSTDSAQWGSPYWRSDGTVTFHGVQDKRDGIFQTSPAGTPALITTGGGVAEPLLPTWSRTDGPLAFAGKDGADWRIWVLTRDGSARAISPSGLDSYAPVWSPDGHRIAFQGGGAGIVTTDGDGSDRRAIVPAQPGVWTHAPTWSPDGQWIAYVSGPITSGVSPDHGDLWAVPSQGGTPVRMTSTGTVYDWRPAWVQ